MRAIQIQSYGGPEVLTLADLPTPEPGPGQIRVRLAATGVNFVETYQRTGYYPMPLPFVPGAEGAGTVSAVGPASTGVRGRRPGRLGRPRRRVRRGGPRRGGPGAAGPGRDRHRDRRGGDAAGDDRALPAARQLPGAGRRHRAGARGGRRHGPAADPARHPARRHRHRHGVHCGEGAAGPGGRGGATSSATPRPRSRREVRRLTDGEGVAAVYDGVGKDTFDAQPGQPPAARLDGALRRGQRTGAAARSAAAAGGRLGVPDPADPAPPHRDRRPTCAVAGPTCSAGSPTGCRSASTTATRWPRPPGPTPTCESRRTTGKLLLVP